MARQEENLGRGCLGRGLELAGPRPRPEEVRLAPEDRGCGWSDNGRRGLDWPDTEPSPPAPRPPPRTAGDPEVPERELPKPDLIWSRGKVVGILSGLQVLSPFRGSGRPPCRGELDGVRVSLFGLFSFRFPRGMVHLAAPAGREGSPRGEALRAPIGSHSDLLRIFLFS